MVSVFSAYRDMPFFRFFLGFVVILEKLIISKIGIKKKAYWFLQRGKRAFWYKISCSGIHSSSDTGINETKSLYGSHLNCGHFPNDVRFKWPEPLERKLCLAATSSPPSSGDMGLQSSLAIGLPSSSESSSEHTALLPFKRPAGNSRRTWGKHILCACASKCMHLWSILQVMVILGIQINFVPLTVRCEDIIINTVIYKLTLDSMLIGHCPKDVLKS